LVEKLETLSELLTRACLPLRVDGWSVSVEEV
jgi:hypothetical protein